MWFKVFVVLVLLGLWAGFFYVNKDHAVDINMVWETYLDVPVFWVAFGAFLVGFVACFLLATFREIRFHREISRLKKERKKLDVEIADLRTLPLHDLPGGNMNGPADLEGESVG